MRVAPGTDSHYYEWFGYYAYKDTPESVRMRELNVASAAYCRLHEQTAMFNECSTKNGGEQYKCAEAYLSWEKAQDCTLNTVQQGATCSKVCHWSKTIAPRDAVEYVANFGIVPLLAVICVAICGRSFVLCCRCIRTMRDCDQMKENFFCADAARECQGNLDVQEEADGDESDASYGSTEQP